MQIRPVDYPQLRLIAWNLDEDAPLEGGLALALYERNWHLIEADELTAEEARLIQHLVKHYGNGVLNV